MKTFKSRVRNVNPVVWLLFLMAFGCIVGYNLELNLHSRSTEKARNETEVVGTRLVKRTKLANCVGQKRSKLARNDNRLLGNKFYTVAPALKPGEPKPLADFYCTGSNDDKVIQEAINMNGSVLLLPGEYAINYNIYLKSNMTLSGSGMNATFLRLVENATAWNDAAMLRGLILEKVTVTSLTLDGNRYGQIGASEAQNYGRYGFYCEVCNDILLEDMRITSFHGYGFDPHGQAGEYVYSTNVHIRRCIAELNGLDGITIDKTINATVEDNISRNNDRHGINLVTGTKNSTVRNNYVDSNGYNNKEDDASPGAGITIQDNSFFGTGFNHIFQNTVVNSARDGIRARGVVGDNISNNTILGQTACISAKNTTDVVIQYNECGNQTIVSRFNQNITIALIN